MKNTELASFAIKQWEDGTVYWYGTCWYACSEALLKSKKNQYPSAYSDSRLAGYRKEIAAGKMCCDCVGLIKGAAWSECGAHASKYGTNGCPDYSAGGMLDFCKKKGMKYGSMDTFPNIPGLLLHKQGHVGVSIGDGYAIEAKGYADDLVKSAIEGRGWTSWAFLPFVEYDAEAKLEVHAYALGERTLKRGMNGTDVEDLQKRLIALGYDCGKWGADGQYGASTKAAVETFQKKRGISDDGIFGKHSFAELVSAESGTPDAPDESGAPEEVEYSLVITGSKAALLAIQEQYGGELCAPDSEVESA